VLAVAFYLRAWKKQDRVRMSAAFLAMAGGMVAHYSAAPYAIFLAIHYLVAVFPSRRDRWKALASVAGSRRRLCSPGSAGASPRTACTGPLRPRLKLQRQRRFGLPRPNSRRRNSGIGEAVSIRRIEEGLVL
jgi:hypothetical protein